MLTGLEQDSKMVGVKQTKWIVSDGKVARTSLVGGADPRVTTSIEALCAEKQILVE